MEWSISLQPQEELAAFARFGNAVASLCVEKKGARACLKNHFRKLGLAAHEKPFSVTLIILYIYEKEIMKI